MKNYSNTTLVLGASPKPERYSNVAMKSLRTHGVPTIGFTRRLFEMEGVRIVDQWPSTKDGIDTITLYLSAKNQQEYIDRIIALRPRRVIFNPGTENPPFQQVLVEAGVVVMEACTLVLLATDQY